MCFSVKNNYTMYEKQCFAIVNKPFNPRQALWLQPLFVLPGQFV